MNIEGRLSDVVGLELEEVLGGVYSPRDARVSWPGKAQELYLGFRITGFRVTGSSDGWSLVLGEGKPKAVDMEELGQISVESLIGYSPFSGLLGKPVVGSLLFLSLPDSACLGFCLFFGGCHNRLVVLNWGDDLYIGTELPTDADPEKITTRHVQGPCRATSTDFVSPNSNPRHV